MRRAQLQPLLLQIMEDGTPRGLPGVFSFSHPSGLLLAAELPGSLACGKTLGALGSFGCPLLLRNRGVHASGRDQSPSFRAGQRGEGGCLSPDSTRDTTTWDALECGVVCSCV